MTIFFICPCPPQASGGVRKIYRFVEILCHGGFDAALVHPGGNRPLWIGDHSVPTISCNTLAVGASDLVVVPEIYAWRLRSDAPRTSRVILNQGAYLTFTGAPIPPTPSPPYLDANIAAALVVSEDNHQYLDYVFPDLSIHRIRLGIDTNDYRPLEKKRQVAFMPRRRSEDAKQVLGIVAVRGALIDWDVVAIDGVPPGSVPTILGESTVFLSLPSPGGEGFPLPALEAMSCGCVVIGYTGRGGREYFLTEHSVPIEEGDIISFAKHLERVLRDDCECERLGQAARDFVRTQYSVSQEEDDVLGAFRKIGLIDDPRPGRIDLTVLKPPPRLRRLGSRVRHLLD